MIKQLLNWFDDRTGYRSVARKLLDESIPGGARWRYVWGSALVYCFVVQAVSGIFLWMFYSPSARSAWESVFFIQFEVDGGWLLRGIHHFTAQAMIVLLAIHLLQVVLDRAYRAPRELNFWLGLVLLQIVLLLALTGYLLPWDQKGYWATNVATNLMSLVPFVGDDLQRLAVGGPSYGHATLTRFFALHAGLLPATLIAVLVLHVALFRRHGITAVGEGRRPAQTFWPHQVLKDGLVCLTVMGVVLLLLFRGLFTGALEGAASGACLGAGLGAPADPAVPYAAARPEWYFLALFQLLKYLEGRLELFGAIAVPGLVSAVLFLMPLTARWRCGHGFNLVLLLAICGGVVFLTIAAIVEDSHNPLHQQAVRQAETDARRAIQLARAPAGIPPSGAVALLRGDAKTQGSILFGRYCVTCHSHSPAEGQAERNGWTAIEARSPSASNLYGFGTQAWIAGLFDPAQIAGPRYFGHTSHHEGDMPAFVQDVLTDREEWSVEQIEQVTAALLEAADHRPAAAENNGGRFRAMAAQGRNLISDLDRCAGCHKFHTVEENDFGPDLTGYASREWMIAFISNPGDARFYGEHNDRMPAFAKEPDTPRDDILSPDEIAQIADWIRGDWYEGDDMRGISTRSP